MKKSNERIMLQIMQHIATNTIPSELRSTPDGSLCLHMLAAKLSETSPLSVRPTQWRMDRDGTVTVTLNARDNVRYGMETCTVTRDQFEDIILQVFSTKIRIAPLETRDWNKFRNRLINTAPVRMIPRDPATNVGRSSGASSLNFF